MTVAPARRPRNRLIAVMASAAAPIVVAIGLTAATAAPAGAQTLPGPTTTTSTVPATTTTTDSAQGGTNPTLPPVPSSTTSVPTPTTAPAPQQTTTTAPPKTTTTKPGPGVPGVPVGGPATSTTTTVPGAPPPPPPDPQPILDQVRADLAQLTAINDYKPTQDLVSAAQARVTQAGVGLQSARAQLQAAQAAQSQAGGRKVFADSQLKEMALAAYIGVGYTTPGFGQPAGGNGHEGQGTVSTPGGLTGVEALDAKELLVLVGQHARLADDEAKHNLAVATNNAKAATAAVHQAQTAVTAAESNLLNAQQTLKIVTAAAITPGAAAASSLPTLASASAPDANTLPPPPPGAASTTTSSTTTTTLPKTLTGAAPAGGTIQLPPAPSPTILGPSVMSATELAAWYVSTGRQPNITVPIAELTQDYQDWGAKTGVAYDIAFAQSVVETGFFSFPAGGQLTSKDNNFAGIGACDTCAHGWSFPDAKTGIGAQLELLEAYASKTKVDTSLVGPVGVGGCCQTWMALAGKWASSLVYGISIMTIYDQMLTWVIPQRLVAAGLIVPPGADAKGPELAPLPCPPAPPAQPGPAKAGAGKPTTTTSTTSTSTTSTTVAGANPNPAPSSPPAPACTAMGPASTTAGANSGGGPTTTQPPTKLASSKS